MMRCDSFAGGAAFAALAAAGWVAWILFAGPWIGARAALTAYLVAVSTAYVFLTARSHRRGGGAAVAVAALTATAYAPTIGQLAVALAVIVAVARIATAHRLVTPRAVAVAAALGGAGLLFARAVAGPSLLSLAMALWAYLLVQSFGFLLDDGLRPSVAAQPDPFEEAHRRALALLDG